MGRLAPITLLPIVVRHWMTVLSKVSDSDIDIKRGDLFIKRKKSGEKSKKKHMTH